MALNRVIAFILVPCLALSGVEGFRAESFTAAARLWSFDALRGTYSAFEEQALNLTELFHDPLLPITPRIGVIQRMTALVKRSFVRKAKPVEPRRRLLDEPIPLAKFDGLDRSQTILAIRLLFPLNDRRDFDIPDEVTDIVLQAHLRYFAALRNTGLLLQEIPRPLLLHKDEAEAIAHTEAIFNFLRFDDLAQTVLKLPRYNRTRDSSMFEVRGFYLLLHERELAFRKQAESAPRRGKLPEGINEILSQAMDTPTFFAVRYQAWQLASALGAIFQVPSSPIAKEAGNRIISELGTENPGKLIARWLYEKIDELVGKATSHLPPREQMPKLERSRFDGAKAEFIMRIHSALLRSLDGQEPPPSRINTLELFELLLPAGKEPRQLRSGA